MVEKRPEKDRAGRLAEALRDNLKRRKAQARAKQSDLETDDKAEAPSDSETATKTPKNR
jgi:hypothetical protein